MAKRRMFSLDVVGTDSFAEMTKDAQALYFQLGMYGDDDGFVTSPRKIARGINCNDSAMDELEENGLIIRFGSGVLVVRDWKINNTLKNDRYKPTMCVDEFKLLQTDENGKYSLKEKDWNQTGTKLEPNWNLNITEHNRTELNE